MDGKRTARITVAVVMAFAWGVLAFVLTGVVLGFIGSWVYKSGFGMLLGWFFAPYVGTVVGIGVGVYMFQRLSRPPKR
jgi:hypothetical protein